MDRFNVAVDADGDYVVDTRQMIAGPPIGTDTFDDRAATTCSTARA